MDVDNFLRRYAAGERDFTQVDLSRANLGGLILNQVDLSGANLRSRSGRSGSTTSSRPTRSS